MFLSLFIITTTTFLFLVLFFFVNSGGYVDNSTPPPADIIALAFGISASDDAVHGCKTGTTG